MDHIISLDLDESQCIFILLLFQELEESFNYGLFFPPANGKAGKFLDEERRLSEYPFPGPIGYLEVRWMVICVSRVTNQTNDIEGDDYCYWAAPTWSWEKLLCLPTLNELPLPHVGKSSVLLKVRCDYKSDLIPANLVRCRVHNLNDTNVINCYKTELFLEWSIF